jgi:predicted nuclease of predicted toxin-antitoxin system
MSIRFHLDENVDHEILRGLRNRGIDVTTPGEAGLLETPDEDHLAYARREGRVIFTHDSDFLRLSGLGHEHAGIIFCRQRSRNEKDIIAFLALIDECLESEDMVGKVENF